MAPSLHRPDPRRLRARRFVKLRAVEAGLLREAVSDGEALLRRVRSFAVGSIKRMEA